jgi:hypothetical protein
MVVFFKNEIINISHELNPNLIFYRFFFSISAFKFDFCP